MNRFFTPKLALAAEPSQTASEQMRLQGWHSQLSQEPAWPGEVGIRRRCVLQVRGLPKPCVCLPIA